MPYQKIEGVLQEIFFAVKYIQEKDFVQTSYDKQQPSDSHLLLL